MTHITQAGYVQLIGNILDVLVDSEVLTGDNIEELAESLFPPDGYFSAEEQQEFTLLVSERAENFRDEAERLE